MRSTLILLAGWLLVSPAVWAQAPDSVRLAEAVDLYRNREDAKAIPILTDLVRPGSNLTGLQRGKAHYYLMQIQWDRDEFASALESGDVAMAQFREAKNDVWQGKTLYTLSMKNLMSGSYETALNQVQEAYEHFSAVGDTAQMVWALGRKGLVFHDIGEYEKGVKACEEADQLHARFSGKGADTQAMIWGITAINYDDNEESVEAVELYYKILDLESELSSKREVIRTWNNLGNSLRKLGQLDKAEYYVGLNLKANEEEQFRYGIATAKTNLGDIAGQKGEFEKAERLLSEAEQIAYEINDSEKILDVLQNQHVLRERMGDSQGALDYLKRYHTVKDSLYGLDTRKQLQLLETRYQTKKKEQQLAVQDAQLAEKDARLRTNTLLLVGAILAALLITAIAILNRNRIKKQQEILLQQERVRAKEAEVKAALNSQEAERTRYARDLHDGFGQLISVLKLKVKSLGAGHQNGQSEVAVESEQVLDEMYHEIKRICFDMMPQTLISGGLTAALTELADRINQTGRLQVTMDFFGLEERLEQDTETALYRIAQEWLNNILKYSDATSVTVQVTRDQAELTFLIEDNGRGFDRSLLTAGSGNGWRNIQSRVDLIKGNLDLETQSGTLGTALIIDVPMTATITRNPA